MKKTTIPELNLNDRKTVDTAVLQSMLGAGRQTAVDIGNAAGARIKVGRRVLWNLSKIQMYLDEISE